MGLTRTGAIMIAGLLLISALLMLPALAKMGYSIRVDAEGTTWEINRSTQPTYFYAEGKVTGEGNFSRRAHIEGDMGIRADELASSTRGGSLNINEITRFFSREGPVVVTANLSSKNLTSADSSSENVTGSATIYIDESWPTYFTSYKETDYLGPAIRTRDRYENNGDVVSSLIESKKLDRQSIFTTQVNKTLIFARVVPGSVEEWRGLNRSSYYATDMKTIGNLVRLNVVKRSIYGDIVSRVSEEYRGQVEMALKMHMDDLIDLPPKKEPEWLPCCAEGAVQANVSIIGADPEDWFAS